MRIIIQIVIIERRIRLTTFLPSDKVILRKSASLLCILKPFFPLQSYGEVHAGPRSQSE
jgi:hypothetical protein